MNFGAPGPTAWASPPPTGGGTCSGPTPGMDSTITTETNQVIGLFTCLRGCRRASDGTDGTCLLTSHHLQEMMDEDLEKRAIEAMPVVSLLRFHSDIISRDSESREKGSRYCGEGAQKGQTWRVDVHTGSQ